MIDENQMNFYIWYSLEIIYEGSYSWQSSL